MLHCYLLSPVQRITEPFRLEGTLGHTYCNLLLKPGPRLSGGLHVPLSSCRRCSPSETAFAVSNHCPPPTLPKHWGKWADSPNRWQLTWKACACNLASRSMMARKGCAKHLLGSLPMLGYSDYFFFLLCIVQIQSHALFFQEAFYSTEETDNKVRFVSP